MDINSFALGAATAITAVAVLFIIFVEVGESE